MVSLFLCTLRQLKNSSCYGTKITSIIHPFDFAEASLLLFMASLSSSNLPVCKMTKLALILVLLTLPAYLASKSAGLEDGDAKSTVAAFTTVSSAGRKMKLGSRPPRCAERCYNCRPCTAALVVSPNTYGTNIEGDETYHLMSWKCQCGSKYYQP